MYLVLDGAVQYVPSIDKTITCMVKQWVVFGVSVMVYTVEVEFLISCV